ncbi:phage head closure protein [Dryocola sp. LX212]
MKAGPLRHRVMLQEPLKTQDPETGAIVDSWVDVKEIFAEVTAVSARDFAAAQAFQNKITSRIKIRYRTGISDKHRILFRGEIYNIEGVLPDPDSGLEYLTLPCSSGVNNG